MYAVIKLVVATFLYCLFLKNTVVGKPIHCHPSILKGIILGAMPHVKELQNRYEQGSHDSKCRHVFQMNNVPDCNLTGVERLPLTLYRLSLVVKVLENMAPDSLVKNNLETFDIIQTELSKCEATKSRKGEVCQRRLMKDTEKVSAECLQSNVLFNLIWTLHEDVGFVLPEDHHRGVQKGSLPIGPNVQSSKKHKGKGKGKHKGKKNKAKSAKPAAKQNI
ncbi:uncharacterized protein [Aquarana catesbeiana]|uniref:uncharacterized protein n=1 Tax=Aquarana catesbeiana TaxID=8400 RepID=UPI003CCA4348